MFTKPEDDPVAEMLTAVPLPGLKFVGFEEKSPAMKILPPEKAMAPGVSVPLLPPKLKARWNVPVRSNST
ncbi:MAG: hypothetical protein ACO33F_08750, partial [Ilumatobacteraceae bacterium]